MLVTGFKLYLLLHSASRCMALSFGQLFCIDLESQYSGVKVPVRLVGKIG